LPPGTTLSLYDIVNTPGVGVDLSHINTAVKVEAFIKNEQMEAALKDADLVVIPAGVPRKPGMTRDDLFKVNAGIVRDLINATARAAPRAIIAIITNPVNSMVPIAAELLKKAGVYDPKKLFGVSTLDIVRAQTFIGEMKKVDPQSVHVNVIGGHSEDTMLPVLSQVRGITFTPDETKDLVGRVKTAGTVVVNAKEGAGSATLSMAYAGARFVNAIVRGMRGEQGVVECAFVQVDGMDTQFMALPVEFGKGGVQKIHPIGDLNDYEKEQYKMLIPLLQKNIETGIEFANQ